MAKSLQVIGALTPVIVARLNQRLNQINPIEQGYVRELSMQRTTIHKYIDVTWLYDTLRLRKRPIGSAPSYATLAGENTQIQLEEYANGMHLDPYDVNSNPEYAQDLFNQLSTISDHAVRLPFILMMKRLNEGHTSAVTMYDAQPYFSNSHTRNGNSYDNLLAGALSETTLDAAMVALARNPSDDESGTEDSEIAMTHIAVPTELDATAARLNTPITLGASNDSINIFAGRFKTISTALLTDANDWYALAVGSGELEKPMIDVRHNLYGQFAFRDIIDSENNQLFVSTGRRFRWWGWMNFTMWPTHPYYAIKFVN